jgi:signal transduction protein with GAF and PtsI domain
MLFAAAPDGRILWAHAGMTTPAAEVGAMLTRHPGLMAELSFRADDIAPGGRLDAAWRRVLIAHAGRFAIGSDTYVAERWADYPALIEAHRRWLAQLPEAVARAIAFDNAQGWFGGDE